MPTAYIFNEHLDKQDFATVERILISEGYDPSYGFPTDISSVDVEHDIGVAALPAASDDEDIIANGTRYFGGAGIRIVSIWLHNSGVEADGLPDGIGKYGSALVSAESDELAKALKGESEAWEQPSGAPRPKPNTKRNKC